MSPQNPITIHYCPTCKVGMDAAFSQPLACPRCGQQRKLLHSYHWFLPQPEPAGWAAEIPIELCSVYEELTTQ